MKNNGITILQIVITVAIMLIILAISIYYGTNVAKEANIATIYNEIKEIESVLKEIYILNEFTVDADNIRFYDEISAPKINNSIYSDELNGNTTGEFYYLDFTTSRKLENTLGLEKVKHDYLFDLANLNIYLVGGVDIIGADGNVIIKYDSDEIVDYYADTFVK